MYLLKFEIAAFINNKLPVFCVILRKEITTPAALNNKVILPNNCCQDFIQPSPEIVPTISQHKRQFLNNDIYLYSLYYEVFSIYKALYVIVNMLEMFVENISTGTCVWRLQELLDVTVSKERLRVVFS